MGLADERRRRTVLITGAGGLLGSVVGRRYLAAGADVLGLDKDWDGARAMIKPAGVHRVDGDVRDTALLRRWLSDGHVDTVVHLAAQTLVGPALLDPADTFSNNIEGSWSVLEACRATPGVRAVVVASTDKAYGDRSGRPYREEMALLARHPYDVSKAATDLLAQSYAATYDLPVTITRCGNMYGGGDLNWSRIVPGHDPFRASTASRRSSARTGPSSATTCTSTTPPAASCSWPTRSARGPMSRARPSTSPVSTG